MSDEQKAFEELQHITPIRFSSEVIELVEKYDISYFEAVSHYCKKYEIEVETVKSLITTDLMDRLTDEGEKHHTVKKSGRIRL